MTSFWSAVHCSMRIRVRKRNVRQTFFLTSEFEFADGKQGSVSHPHQAPIQSLSNCSHWVYTSDSQISGSLGLDFLRVRDHEAANGQRCIGNSCNKPNVRHATNRN